MQPPSDSDEDGVIPIEALCASAAGDPVESAAAIVACLIRFDEAAPVFRADLARAADGLCETEEEAQRFFAGLHILAGGRDAPSFPILLRLLRRPYEDTDWLLGDAATATLPRIAASVFDGDADALFGAIADTEIDDFIRYALLGAAAFLTWDGRIELAATTRFLERFDDEHMAVDGEFVWSSWQTAIALLGLRALTPRVERALENGRIDSVIDGRDHFPTLLARAEADPRNGGRFSEEDLGYVEDVVDELMRFPSPGHGEPDEDRDLDPLDDWLLSAPASNPLRHVGRNDPCPCGSGKKYKKCCLAGA